MEDSISKGRNAALAYSELSKGALIQASETAKDNAKLQAAANGNTTEETFSSILTNPYRVHEGEAPEVMEDVRDRFKSGIKSAMTNLKHKGMPAIDQFKARRDAALTNTHAITKYMGQELGAVLMKMGDLKVAGWKLFRLAGPWALVSKTFTVNAEVGISLEGPLVQQVAQVTNRESTLDMTTADTQIVLVQDAIHRISDTLGIDAKQLTLLIKAAALMHSEGSFEIAAKDGATLSSEAHTAIIAGEEAAVWGDRVVLGDRAGGCIVIQNGIVNINPISPPSAQDAVTVDPITLITAEGGRRAIDSLPQYQGTNGHGAMII